MMYVQAGLRIVNVVVVVDDLLRLFFFERFLGFDVAVAATEASAAGFGTLCPSVTRGTSLLIVCSSIPHFCQD